MGNGLGAFQSSSWQHISDCGDFPLLVMEGNHKGAPHFPDAAIGVLNFVAGIRDGTSRIKEPDCFNRQSPASRSAGRASHHAIQGIIESSSPFTGGHELVNIIGQYGFYQIRILGFPGLTVLVNQAADLFLLLPGVRCVLGQDETGKY